jgi:glycosyltransferase involved in cell wall biosynthesis
MSTAPERPTFSVVTPSYEMRGHLPLCVRSVADQQGVSVEHVVVDGGSRDGSVEWLREHPELTSISEPDEGMYDALNKALAMAKGSLIGHLNCDEQYLPGTLEHVQGYFAAHPEVDMVFGDALLLRPDGSLIAYRKAYQPRTAFIRTSHLYVLTCAMFFRRRILDDGLRFSTAFKAVSDELFVLEVLRKGYAVRTMRRYLSAFTMTGGNLGSTRTAQREIRQVARSSPIWMRLGTIPLNILRLTSKAASGAYSQQAPLHYEVFTSPDADQRQSFTEHNPRFRWRTG